MILQRVPSSCTAVATHLHSKRLHASGNFTTNAAKADYPQGFPLQFHPHEEGSLPLALLHGGVALGDIAGHCQQESAGLLRSTNGVSSWSAADQVWIHVMAVR